MYDAGLIQMERDGTLADPDYIELLGKAERAALEQRRQNIMPFSVLLAGLEVGQFLELATGLANVGDFGRQQYDFATGEIGPDHSACHPDCEYARMTGVGSRVLPVLSADPQHTSQAGVKTAKKRASRRS